MRAAHWAARVRLPHTITKQTYAHFFFVFVLAQTASQMQSLRLAQAVPRLAVAAPRSAVRSASSLAGSGSFASTVSAPWDLRANAGLQERRQRASKCCRSPAPPLFSGQQRRWLVFLHHSCCSCSHWLPEAVSLTLPFPPPPRSAPRAPRQAYQFIFKRNVTYIAYIVTGAVVLEGVFGTVSQSFWGAMNHGVRAPRPRAELRRLRPRAPPPTPLLTALLALFALLHPARRECTRTRTGANSQSPSRRVVRVCKK